MFVSTKQKRIATLARNNPAMAFTSLNHYIDYNWLLQACQLTRKDGATGVDDQTADMYERQLETNLLDLLDRMKSGRYRAPALRRVYIPKGKGQQRSLGIPTFGQDCPESGSDVIGAHIRAGFLQLLLWVSRAGQRTMPCKVYVVLHLFAFDALMQRFFGHLIKSLMNLVKLNFGT